MCFFFQRQRQSPNDKSSYLRDSSDPNHYYPAIKSAIELGWQVFLSGNVSTKETWFDDFGEKLIYPQKFNDTDLYNVFVELKLIA